MRSEIRVVADNGQEFKFDLDQATPLTPQAGREWLDAECTRLECEPLRPTGKLLLADKVMVVARDAGPQRLSDPEWGPTFARAAAATLGKPIIHVDLASMTLAF